MREWMSTGGGNLQSVLRCKRCQLASKIDDLLSRASRVAADLGAELDHRLMHLRLNVLFQNHFAAGENLLNVRTQLARFRIDDLEFFLDSESEDVILRAHRSSQYHYASFKTDCR